MLLAKNIIEADPRQDFVRDDDDDGPRWQPSEAQPKSAATFFFATTDDCLPSDGIVVHSVGPHVWAEFKKKWSKYLTDRGGAAAVEPISDIEPLELINELVGRHGVVVVASGNELDPFYVSRKRRPKLTDEQMDELALLDLGMDIENESGVHGAEIFWIRSLKSGQIAAASEGRFLAGPTLFGEYDYKSARPEEVDRRQKAKDQKAREKAEAAAAARAEAARPKRNREEIATDVAKPLSPDEEKELAGPMGKPQGTHAPLQTTPAPAPTPAEPEPTPEPEKKSGESRQRWLKRLRRARRALTGN